MVSITLFSRGPRNTADSNGRTWCLEGGEKRDISGAERIYWFTPISRTEIRCGANELQKPRRSSTVVMYVRNWWRWYQAETCTDSPELTSSGTCLSNRDRMHFEQSSCRLSRQILVDHCIATSRSMGNRSCKHIVSRPLSYDTKTSRRFAYYSRS